MKKSILFLASLAIATTISTFAFWAKSYELEIANKELASNNANLLVELMMNQTDMSLTKENVDIFINSLPFADKELIKRQYRLETGNLTSYGSRYENNLFGMKTSSRKHTYMGVSKDNYVIYAHWTLSVVDRLLYEIYVGTSLKNYSTDTNYLRKLK